MKATQEQIDYLLSEGICNPSLARSATFVQAKLMIRDHKRKKARRKFAILLLVAVPGFGGAWAYYDYISSDPDDAQHTVETSPVAPLTTYTVELGSYGQWMGGPRFIYTFSHLTKEERRLMERKNELFTTLIRGIENENKGVETRRNELIKILENWKSNLPEPNRNDHHAKAHRIYTYARQLTPHLDTIQEQITDLIQRLQTNVDTIEARGGNLRRGQTASTLDYLQIIRQHMDHLEELLESPIPQGENGRSNALTEWNSFEEEYQSRLHSSWNTKALRKFPLEEGSLFTTEANEAYFMVFATVGNKELFFLLDKEQGPFQLVHLPQGK